MSPEVVSHAMQEYIKALQEQIVCAELFYFGDVQGGMKALFSLPEDIRLQVDQLIWQITGGEPIDPTEERAQKLISAAVMRSVELRMGVDEGMCS